MQHAYEPAAEDEIRLQAGESVKLDLLFNDGGCWFEVLCENPWWETSKHKLMCMVLIPFLIGWAKGTNESSGKSGLLPVACLKQVE